MAGADGCTYTTDEALSRVGFGRFQELLLGLLGTGCVAEAMEVMLLSFVGPSIEAEFGVSSVITSVVFAGMIVGAWLGGFGSDRYGRKSIYPSSCRNTGVGVTYSDSRVGSMVALLVTTALIENCRQKEVVLVMNMSLFLTGAACALFPFETKGREIQ